MRNIVTRLLILLPLQCLLYGTAVHAEEEKGPPKDPTKRHKWMMDQGAAYPDEAVQAYVRRIGMQLAKVKNGVAATQTSGTAGVANVISDKEPVGRVNGEAITYEELARGVPLKANAQETLRLLNGHYPSGEPRAGDFVKIIQ